MRGGYGCIWDSTRMWYAHRVAWQLYKGDIPDQLKVLHKCDVPNCVNPDHLFLGTQADNVHDCENKGRSRHPSGDQNGMRKKQLRTTICQSGQ